jgi:hypothetical protein
MRLRCPALSPRSATGLWLVVSFLPHWAAGMRFPHSVARACRAQALALLCCLSIAATRNERDRCALRHSRTIECRSRTHRTAAAAPPAGGTILAASRGPAPAAPAKRWSLLQSRPEGRLRGKTICGPVPHSPPQISIPDVINLFKCRGPPLDPPSPTLAPRHSPLPASRSALVRRCAWPA